MAKYKVLEGARMVSERDPDSNFKDLIGETVEWDGGVDPEGDAWLDGEGLWVDPQFLEPVVEPRRYLVVKDEGPVVCIGGYYSVTDRLPDFFDWDGTLGLDGNVEIPAIDGEGPNELYVDPKFLKLVDDEPAAAGVPLAGWERELLKSAKPVWQDSYEDLRERAKADTDYREDLPPDTLTVTGTSGFRPAKLTVAPRQSSDAFELCIEHENGEIADVILTRNQAVAVHAALADYIENKKAVDL